ncbi:hypothetical protein P3X46_029780 [Hevea brasiliensis]|uniref:Uncharacterized protein n=1 Tax=Hevea brasiliensis TaxID=3981 RepID=A0ABQ9KUQ0_HEVBR|nr:hypothetical protein P3X46_029780 [Hevea brasiliensis]
METGDPFASIPERCHISSSQEEHLRRCRFACEPEDENLFSDESGDLRVTSAGVTIVSLPESPEDNENGDKISRDDDAFITLPEQSTLAASQEKQQQTVAVGNRDDRKVEGVANDEEIASVDGNYADDLIAVDMGGDTVLGFSAEVELTERIAIDRGSLSSPGVDRAQKNEVIHCESTRAQKNEVIRCESTNTRIMNRELAATPSDGLCESLIIIPKTVDKNVGLSTPELHLGTRTEKTLERVVKSVKKLKSSLKKSKILDENLVLKTSKATLVTETENLGEIVDSSDFEGFSPSNCLQSLHNHQIDEPDGADRECHGDSSAKRKLAGTLESDFKENNAVIEIGIECGNEGIEDDEANRLCNISQRFSDAIFSEKQKDNKAKGIDDMDKFRFVGPVGAKRCSDAKFPEKLKDDKAENIDDIDKLGHVGPMGANPPEKKRNVRAQRVLPKSLCGNFGNVRGEPVPDDVLCSRNFKKVTILDVLKMVSQDYNYDPSVLNGSVMGAAKRRGMTFP